MYGKLNDWHKTAYPQRVQYLDGSYRLSLLLKLITLSHDTRSFGKPFQTDTERWHTIFMNTLLLNNFLVILKLTNSIIAQTTYICHPIKTFARVNA